MKEIAIGTQLTPDGGSARSLQDRIASVLSGVSHNEVRVRLGKPVGAYQFVHVRGAAPSSNSQALGGEAFDRIVAAVADWALSTATARQLRRLTHRLVIKGEVESASIDAFVASARGRLEARPESDLPPLPHLRGLLKDHIVATLQVSPRFVVDGVLRFRCPEILRAVEGAVNQTLDAERRGEVQSGKRVSLEDDAELLALLRGFVEMHDVKSGEVQVHPRPDGPPGRFVIYNTDGEVMETEYLEGIPSNWIESEVEYQDLLMSALISLGPSRIHLHLAPDSEVVADVRRVFEERADVCPGCEKCSATRSGPRRGTPDRRGRAGT